MMILSSFFCLITQYNTSILISSRFSLILCVFVRFLNLIFSILIVSQFILKGVKYSRDLRLHKSKKTSIVQ